MLQVCKNLFEKWNADVRYCHWKSNEHLMEGLDGKTDLDVFVFPEDREKAEAHLSSCEYIKFVPQKGCRYPNVDEWIGFDYATGCLVHIHLHYQIITGTKYVKEYILPIDEVIIDTRILDKDSNVYITHPELESIILYCRIALKSRDPENVKINSDVKKEIDYVHDRLNKESLLILCKKIIGNEKGQSLFDIIIKEEMTKSDWFEVFNIAKVWLAPYKKFNVVQTWYYHNLYYFITGVKYTLNRKLGKNYIVRKTMPCKGLCICFVGADGSGKSTITSHLLNWLTWKVDANRFYLGSGDGYRSVLQRIIGRLNRKKVSKSFADVDYVDHVDHTKHHQRKNLRSVLGMILVALNALVVVRKALTSAMTARQYSMKGAIALMDRFPQIQFEGVYDGPKIHYLAKKKNGESMFTEIAGKYELNVLKKIQKFHPDIVFKLLLPVEESMRRKPFEDRESVTRKSIITPQLVFENSKVYDIDATLPFNEEMLEIKRVIWKNMLKSQKL